MYLCDSGGMRERVYVQTFWQDKRNTHLLFYPIIIFHHLCLLSSLHFSQTWCIRNMSIYVVMDKKIQSKFKITTITTTCWRHFILEGLLALIGTSVTICCLNEALCAILDFNSQGMPKILLWNSRKKTSWTWCLYDLEARYC